MKKITPVSSLTSSIISGTFNNMCPHEISTLTSCLQGYRKFGAKFQKVFKSCNFLSKPGSTHPLQHTNHSKKSKTHFSWFSKFHKGKNIPPHASLWKLGKKIQVPSHATWTGEQYKYCQDPPSTLEHSCKMFFNTSRSYTLCSSDTQPQPFIK